MKSVLCRRLALYGGPAPDYYWDFKDTVEGPRATSLRQRITRILRKRARRMNQRRIAELKESV